jgi:hypothetical protein
MNFCNLDQQKFDKNEIIWIVWERRMGIISQIYRRFNSLWIFYLTKHIITMMILKIYIWKQNGSVLDKHCKEIVSSPQEKNCFLNWLSFIEKLNNSHLPSKVQIQKVFKPFEQNKWVVMDYKTLNKV